MSARDDETDDARLFREAIGHVRPLQSEAPPPKPKPEPKPVQSENDEARVRDELLAHAIDPASIEVGDEIHYLKVG